MATKVIGIRVSEDEYKALEEMANRRATTISALAYDAVIKIIRGGTKPTVGSVTEEVLGEYLENHLDQLKHELLEELKQQQTDPPQADLNEKAKPKPQPSTPSAENGISARQLAKRLGCDRKTLSRWKEKGNDYLAERTRERDPEGKAWLFDEQTTMYVEESNGV